MDSILKIVYTNSFYHNGSTHYYFNGLHPEIIKHLDQCSAEQKSLFNLDNEVAEIQNKNRHNNWQPNYCFSNFNSYFHRHLGVENSIHIDDVKDDDSIYLFPIEVRTTISSFYEKHKFELNGETYEYTFVDTIPQSALQKLRSGKLKLVINIIHDPCSQSSTLKLFEDYMASVGIDPENIIVIFGNNYQKYFTDYPDSKLKITWGIMPIQQQAAEMGSYPKITSLGYMSDIVRPTDLNKDVYRTKKFLCYNRTMKDHRYALAYFAIKYNLIANSIFSFLNSNLPTESLASTVKMYLGQDKEKALKIAEVIQNLMPLEIDTDHLMPDQKHGFVTDNNKKEFYSNTYIHITSESLFEYGDSNNPFFSEKTLRPIQNLQPFLYVGNPHSLKLLRELGFKTFHPFIDESYDEEEDPVTRMQLIEKEIERLNNLSMQELHNLYYDMVDLVVHNQTHLLTFANINPYDYTFDLIKKWYLR
jgi:hypothetical protein